MSAVCSNVVIGRILTRPDMMYPMEVVILYTNMFSSRASLVISTQGKSP